MAVLPRIGGAGDRRVVAVRRACLMVVAGLGTWLAVVVAAPAAQAAVPDCAAVVVGKVSCFGPLSPTGTALRAQAATATTSTSGLGPVDLRYAYGLEYSALTGGVGQTVAVVTAFDDPNAQPDLAAYRAAYSLPPCGSGCFTRVDQAGGTNYPPAVPGWSAGVAQALDTISAVCPNCHLLLVEATSTLFTDLGAAENTAVQLGAKFVTNNWETPELSFQPGDEANLDAQYFNHPGVVITAADGNGAGNGNTYYPAASPDVIAVGGTTLARAASTVRGWTETAWSGTGSGCSPSEAKPSWQTDTGCTNRTLNDVSAVADTASGVAYFDTESGGLVPGFGSGMFAAALVTGAYALAGTPASGSNPASYLYAHHGAGLVADITSGSTGVCAGPPYYCTAAAGYDGPSGLGAPTSAMALGAHAPSDSLTAAPAAYNPIDGNLWVFGTGTANGTVWGDTSKPSGGWSGWKNMGGTLAGKPLSAFYDPAGALEVYGLRTDGHVAENYTRDGVSWNGWTGFAAPVTFKFAPSVVWDPLSGSIEVWEVATTGAAYEDIYHAGAGWAGWQNRGGSFSSALHAVYDPVNRAMRVFGVGKANGTVWGASVTSSGAFSGWGNMSGALSSNPLSALYDPASRRLEVYGLAADGHATENWTADGVTWNGFHDLGNAAPGGGTLAFGVAPSALYDPLNGSLELWVVATTKTVFDNVWTPGVGWSGWQNRSGTIASSVDPLYDLASGSLRAFGVGNANGTVWGDSWTPSAGFSGWGNMSGTLQTGDF